MEIFNYTPDDADEWDAFAGTHPLASYGHTSAQFALAAATPGVRNVSIMVRDGRTLVGVLPLFVTDHHALRRVPVRELVSGTFFPGGPLVSPKLQGKAEGRVTDAMLAAVRDRAAALKADRVVITHPTVMGGQPSIVRYAYSPLLHHGYKARSGVGMLLDLSQTIDQLGAGRRSGCRQTVNKAQASGATVTVMADRAEWTGCYDINVQTLGALAYSRRQMNAIWDSFIAPGHATAYATHVHGVIAAVVVTIHFNGSAYYWIGLNRRPAPLQGAGHLALWTAILAARERGLTHFELGSLDFENPKNIGISQFKQSFGGVPYQIISAQLEAKPVKSAALALGEAVIAAVRNRRKNKAAQPAAATTPAASLAPKNAPAGVAPALSPSGQEPAGIG